jgi:hypothetical protein
MTCGNFIFFQTFFHQFESFLLSESDQHTNSNKERNDESSRGKESRGEEGREGRK